MPSVNFLPGCGHAVSQVRQAEFLTSSLLFWSRALSRKDLHMSKFEKALGKFLNSHGLAISGRRGHEHTDTRGRGRCVVHGRRGRRRRSTASPLHKVLDPGKFFICEVSSSSFKLVQEFALVLLHLLLKFFRCRRSPSLAVLKAPTLSVLISPLSPTVRARDGLDGSM